jgi:Mis12 protein
MKKFAALTLSIFLTYGTALADTPKAADAPADAAKAAKAAKAKAAKAAKGAESSEAKFAAELEELRQTLQAQQEQLQLLKEELAKRDRQIESARDTAATANTRAIEATSKAAEAVSTSAEVKTTATSLNSTVSDLKASNDSLRETVATAAAQEKKSEEEGPVAIHYKGITITPGGFIEAATVTRSRAESADINSDFKGIPFPGASLAKVAENNFTARQSRATVLFEGRVASAKLSGYYEGDFLNAGVTSNNRQSNSYPFRQRQVWGQVAFDSGWSFTGGQMWTLATENRKGINNRTEDLPMMVDPQYVVGFTWARQYGFRVVRDFGGKVALALSVEGPQATLGGRGFTTFTSTSALGAVSTAQNFFINAPGDAAGLLNSFDATGYTVNKSPDIIAKAAFDPGFGHYEILGIVSVFRNRIFPCAVAGTNAANIPAPATPVVVDCPVTGTPVRSAAGAFNDTRAGGGLGASALFSAFNKKVDFGVKAVAGDGIGRYGSAQLADETFRPDGTAALIRTAHALGRIELHPNPKLDVYLYGGSEYAWRAAYTGYQTITQTATPAIPATATSPAIPATTNTTISLTGIGGYGSPAANNSGCSTETVPTGSFTPGGGGTCAGDIRIITEGTVGFWHKFYNGPHGGMRWGLAYSYITKSGWSGSGGLPAGTPGISPKAVDNMVWTSFRYYIP